MITTEDLDRWFTAAIRKVREAVMTANAAIACEPRSTPRERA